MTHKCLWVCCFVFFLTACHPPSVPDSAENTPRQAVRPDDPVPVAVQTLQRRTFSSELICNGRAVAYRKSILTFRTSGIVEEVFVRNGSRIGQNEVIATLVRTDAAAAYRSALLGFRRTEIQLKNRLIDFGYRLEDTLLMPRETLDILYISTGFAEAELNLAQAGLNLERCTLRAPFAGRIADLACTPFEAVQGPCCTLIDDSHVDVVFNLMETELSFAEPNGRVTVTPFNEPAAKLEGRIIAVNPAIDRNGQIAVTARVRNDGKLLDGMNVRVILSQQSEGRLVVPRSAVTVRDGLDVVFRCVGNRSVWTYVDILMSNSTEHVVAPAADRTSSLQEGDTLIVSGLFNMGDDVPVRPFPLQP